MNKLELCQAVRQDAGMSGTGPVTTINQSGQMLECVTWVDRAYQAIQNENNNWLFLRKSMTYQMTPGTQDYNAAMTGLSDHAQWLTSTFRVVNQVNTELYLIPIPWDEYRDTYLFGLLRTKTGLPVYMARKPDNSLSFFPTPDQNYTVYGDYIRTPYVMTADTSQPIFPAQYHMLIVWRALMYYGVTYAANEVYVNAENEYKKLMHDMQRNWLPKARIAGALA